MVDGLLLGQPHNYSDALDQGAWRPASGPVARARQLLEEQPEEPWSTSSLAARVHLSARSLQEGFARDQGVPPMKYLQQVRLRRARDLLREGPRRRRRSPRWRPDWGCPTWDASPPPTGGFRRDSLGDPAPRLIR